MQSDQSSIPHIKYISSGPDIWKERTEEKKEEKEEGWENPFLGFCPQQQAPVCWVQVISSHLQSVFSILLINTIRRLMELLAHSNSNQSASQAVSPVSAPVCRDWGPYCRCFPAYAPSGTLSAVLSVSKDRSRRPNLHPKGEEQRESPKGYLTPYKAFVVSSGTRFLLQKS